MASPLGFAESTRAFISLIKERILSLGHEPVDPWSSSNDLEAELFDAAKVTDLVQRREAYHNISMRIAERNSRLLRNCDSVFAVLDGVDVDSGTASEIGYAYGLGDKIINGYRGDFRRSGENDGVLINLQVQYWIESSGGRIVTSLDQIGTLIFAKDKR